MLFCVTKGYARQSSQTHEYNVAHAQGLNNLKFAKTDKTNKQTNKQTTNKQT